MKLEARWQLAVKSVFSSKSHFNGSDAIIPNKEAGWQSYK